MRNTSPYAAAEALIEMAIEQSRLTDSIVTLDNESWLLETLRIHADDSADNDSVIEFWGADWRVHVRTREEANR